MAGEAVRIPLAVGKTLVLSVVLDLFMSLDRLDAIPVAGWTAMLTFDGDHPEDDCDCNDHDGAQSDELGVRHGTPGG